MAVKLWTTQTTSTENVARTFLSVGQSQSLEREDLSGVREALGANYHHRLMEYNNDHTIRLDDVQSLFKEALNRIEKP